MEHVSTLCAAGTIGIAATGFALGRPLPAKQRPLTARRRRQSLLTKSHHSPANSLSEPRPATAAHPGIAEPRFLHQDSISQDLAAQSRSDRGAEPSLARLPDDKFAVRPRRRTYVGPGVKIVEGEVAGVLPSPSTTGRPSSSWIRRLSTITSSINGSSVSGSRPPTPSINSSTTPFFPSTFPAATPNKLVKRSTSSHGFHQSRPSLNSSTGPSPLLRRPATSHQRSATMRHRSSTDSRVGSTPPKLSPSFPPAQDESCVFTMSHDGLWRPYFNRYRASNVGERHAKRRVSASKQRNRSPHRILAHPSVPPTLLLASSISTSGRKPNPVANSEQSMVCEDEPRWNATTSRDLPPGNRNALQQDDANAHPFIQENHKPAPSDPWIMQNHAFQRSSFSQGTEHSNPSPMVFSGQSKSERLNGTSIRMRRRGNITDPEIFRRPRTSSQVELGVYFDRINQAPEDFAPKPRLRHHPSFTDLRFEALCLAAADSDSVFDIKLPARDTPSPNSPGVERIVHSSGNQRHSAAASDPASTLVGSDNDIKVFSSGEDDDTDFQSDIAFDSFPSRAPVHSKTNRRGPRIETIFDQSIPITSPKLVSLSSERYPSRIDSTSNEPESYDQDFAEFSDETWHLCDIHSSPPQLKLPTHEAFEEDSWSSSSRNPSAHRLLSKLQTSSTPQPRTGDLSSLAHQRASDLESPRTNINSNPAPSASRTSAPRPHSSVTLHENLEKSSRLCLYDWSEQQSVKKDDQGFEARPRTSHIEQFLDLRGGRTALRRTSSSLHLRSQSVPIPRDPSTQMEANTAKKFATWGLGNKGASEDWDGDFDFGDNDRPLQTNSTSTEKHDDKIDGNQTVRVPKAIMDRQESVYGQYSHVQELTVLVEELKLLRARARAMQIIDGPSSELWKEAQGIISLATFEEDEEQEHELRLKRSTSSLTFSLDEFEVDGVCDRRTSGLADTLALNDDQFHPPEATYPSRSGRPSRRARTESSTKAKYVLDSIHRERRLREDGNVRVGSDGQQKLAFDTQSLRDLVIRAGVVTRALKDAVRKAEGVCIDPETNNPTPDPPFSRIFTQPQGELIATGIRS